MTAPAQALNIIIGFSPGSASDDIAHLIAPPLAARLNRPVVMTRIAGDSGTRGAHAAAQCAPDGNTLFMATLGTHALAHHARGDLPYDALRDFAPVSLLTLSPMLLACHPALPAANVNDFVAHARAHPGALAHGTSAFGGAPHLAAELFQAVTGVTLRHARYDDTRKLYDDLEAGRIALSFNNIQSMLPRCRAGTLRALGVTAAARVAAAPDVPTFAENGLHGCEMANWVGLVAPRATPAAIVQTIAGAAAAVIRSDAVFATLTAAGITPCGLTPELFHDYMAAERERWGPVVRRFAAHA
jgi:tripartite-type tricarboxylate transporter receptor subunit TctC